MSAEEKNDRPKRRGRPMAYATRIGRDAGSGKFSTFIVSGKNGRVRPQKTHSTGAAPLSSEAVVAAVEEFVATRREAAPAQHAHDDQVRNATKRLLGKRMGLMMMLADR